MSGIASSLYQVTITSEPRSALLRLWGKLFGSGHAAHKRTVRWRSPRDIIQSMSVTDRDLQSRVFWHPSCFS